MNGRPMIIISGPTATGKSALGVRLAKDIGGEIISADSMQVYRHMDIGTAKITREEMDGVPHHMIDIVDPSRDYSIAEYKADAKNCVEEIYGRGSIPILVGGTGFYIRALLYDTDFEESDTGGEIRRRLHQFADENGLQALHDRLESIDPDAASAIHSNDITRVVRALEFYEITGNKISDHNKKEMQKESPYEFLYVALDRDREVLYRAIEERVDRMMEAGLLDEVIRLRDMGCTSGMVSMKGIGYKELLDHLDGRCTLEEAVENIKTASRHYAKRQWTWLNREKDVNRIQSPVSEEDYRWILDRCMKILE